MSVRFLLALLCVGLVGVVVEHFWGGWEGSRGRARNGVCPVCEMTVFIPHAEKMTRSQREFGHRFCPNCGVESPVSAYLQGKADAEDPVGAREREGRWRAKVREGLYQAQEHYVPASPEVEK